MTIDNFSLEEVLNLVIDWAKETGKIHLSYFRSNNLGIDTKSNIYDVVTKADKESEAYLIHEIEKQFPSHAILGEETGMHESKSDFLWVIDPLDGTNNFSQGLPIFTVSIGLQYKGETLLGVVYAPYFNELYIAIKGNGAYLNGKSITVSKKKNLKECVLGTGFPYDKDVNPDNNISNFATIVPGLRGIRRMGSAAYDLCCVAAGWLDGYWELNINLWDACAGSIIVKEAGGEVFHFREDRNISIIAGNSTILSKIKEIVK